MGKDDVGVKKRRKLAPAASVDSMKPTVVITPDELYQRAVAFEEAEAAARSADHDAKLFADYCQNIRQLMADIAQLKASDTEEAKGLINSKRIEASLQLVTLKKLNRLEKFRMKSGRDALHKEKQRVDSTHLQLQNLLYEAEHLNKEVTKCLQFRSKDEEIDLVPVTEFYKEAPADISRMETTKKDEHQLQLARLEWELRQRRELASSCGELEGSKERVAAAIAAARSRLDGLAPHLSDILKATKPLQECLALNLDEKREELKSAALLPPPLFLLYANSTAYSDAFGGSTLSVSISGDEEEARRLDQQKQVEESMPSNDSDSDQEANDDEQRDKKKRHHRSSKVTREEKAEAKRKEVLKRHPLTVHLSVKIKDGTTLKLVFSYLMRLKIVTVKCTVSVPWTVTGVSAADVLVGANVVDALYPGDTGLDSPHPTTEFILKSAGVSGSFAELVAELGRPYVWAQRVCGLDFMAATLWNGNGSKPISPCISLSAASVQNIVATLKTRLKARVELMKELQELESGKVSPPSGAFTLRLSGSLTQWQSIGWPEYFKDPSTQMLISESLVDSEDMLYRAIVTRQSAKLVALVALKSGYPKVAPIFSLTLHWNGTHHAGTDDDIRDMERIINTNDSGEERASLLSQMARLLACLDILLEALGSSEFPPDKVMFRLVRGRTRAKPYKFLKQGSGVFTQY